MIALYHIKISARVGVFHRAMNHNFSGIGAGANFPAHFFSKFNPFTLVIHAP